MTSRAILALDFGTSAVKAALVDDRGAILAQAQRTYPTEAAQPGHSEQDPDEWWRAATEVVRACGAADGCVAAVAITGQMQDVVLLDSDARPVRPALLYSDLRAQREYQELATALPEWNTATGNAQDAASVAAKLSWLLRHEPDAVKRTQTLTFGPAGAIAHRLGAAAACDIVTASTTGLLDADGGSWRADVLNAIGLPAQMLPKLIDSAEPGAAIVGQVDADAAAEWGIRSGTPIVLALGDAGSATDGLVGTAAGSSYAYLGTTGWYAKVVTSGPRNTGSDYLYRLTLPGRSTSLAIGGILAAGGAADWARRTFLPQLTFAQADEAALDRLASSAAPDLLCLPGLAGERSPVRNPDVRGSFVGATPATEPIDLYLAVLAGVAFNLRHIADDLGGHHGSLTIAGGASASPAWRQLLADIFDTSITTVNGDFEAGIHSAARSGAGALGWGSIPPALDIAPTSTVAPTAGAARFERLRQAHRSLYAALAPAFAALSSTPTRI